MKLNPDCIREVLLYLEELPYHATASIPDISNSLKKFSREDVEYTCLQLHEAGLIRATIKHLPSSNYDYIKEITDITYQGHQFIEGIRNPKAWKAVKSGCESVGNFALKTISSIAEGIATAAIQSYISKYLNRM